MPSKTGGEFADQDDIFNRRTSLGKVNPHRELSGNTQTTRVETSQPNWHFCAIIHPKNSSNSRPGLGFDEFNSFAVELQFAIYGSTKMQKIPAIHAD